MSEKRNRAVLFFQSLSMRPPVLVPYLVVLLFAANESVWILSHAPLSLWSLMGNTAILLTLAFAVHFLAGLLITQRYLSGIMAGYVLFIAVYYYDLYNLIFERVPWIAQHISHAYNVFLITLFIMAGVLLWLVIRPLKEKLKYFNYYLITILTLFISIEVGKALLFKPFKVTFTTLPQKAQMISHADTVSRPDIYYIILDSYTASRSLHRYWDYHNPLDTLLKHEGFYVAGESSTNYNCTVFSLSSSLNMSYLNIRNAEESSRVTIATQNQLSSSGLLTDFLIRHGYDLKVFSLFDFMGKQNYYGLDYSCPGFFDRTFFQLIKVKLGLKKTKPFFGEKEKSREILDAVTTLSKTKAPKPRFIYAHIFLPHPPFFYDASGAEMSDAYAFTSPTKEKYLAQLKYVNTLIGSTLQQMLSVCGDHSIIILQGDHGYRFIAEEPSDARTDESVSIFNAYYFPDQDYRLLYDSISPVNTFRVILNKEFGTGLPLLPDTSYNLPQERWM